MFIYINLVFGNKTWQDNRTFKLNLRLKAVVNEPLNKPTEGFDSKFKR